MQDASAASQAPAPAAVRMEAGPTTAAQTIAVPRSAQEIAGLRSRRAELVDQLDRAGNRRDHVLREMRRGSVAEQRGLEQRLAALDARIVQIEADIAATERALTNTPASVLGAAAQAEEAAAAAHEASLPPIDRDMAGILAMMAMAMMIPIVIAVTRRIVRRPSVARSLSAATEGRIERIEQAVEAIAIEVERVSEGQRFVTKVLSETRPAPLSRPADR